MKCHIESQDILDSLDGRGILNVLDSLGGLGSLDILNVLHIQPGSWRV